MRTLQHLIFGLVIIGLIILLPIGLRAAISVIDDRPPLQRETIAMTAKVDETLDAFGQGRQYKVLPANTPINLPAPPFGKYEERLNYHKCNGARNIVFPGWEAFVLYAISTHGAQDRAAVFAKVEALWSTYGGELTEGSSANGGLALKLDQSQFRLNVGLTKDSLMLSGGTDCLPE